MSTIQAVCAVYCPPNSHTIANSEGSWFLPNANIFMLYNIKLTLEIIYTNLWYLISKLVNPIVQIVIHKLNSNVCFELTCLSWFSSSTNTHRRPIGFHQGDILGQTKVLNDSPFETCMWFQLFAFKHLCAEIFIICQALGLGVILFSGCFCIICRQL